MLCKTLRSELYRIAGVDLTDIPGVSAIAAQVVLTKVGPDVSRFRNASAFASWLGLCPDNESAAVKCLGTGERFGTEPEHDGYSVLYLPFLGGELRSESCSLRHRLGEAQSPALRAPTANL